MINETNNPRNLNSGMANSLNHRVELTCAAEIPPQPINWLWNGWIAAGKFHILAGAPGTGKTTIALNLAATVSNGGLGQGSCSWPGQSFAPKGKVLIWSGEDGIEDTIVPRLIAADANMQNVHVIRGANENNRPRPFDFKRDLAHLSNQISQMGGVLVVFVDSIVEAVAGDSNKNSEVRRALAPLVQLAERHNCAIVGISHVTKGSKRKDPLDRVAGSLAFGAVARVVMMTAKISADQSDDGPSHCVLVRVKSNIGRDDGGFEYSTHAAEFVAGSRSIATSRIVWDRPLQGSARDILNWAENDSETVAISALDQAANFLRLLLANGPLAFSVIETQAQAAGISMASIKRAKS